jgi:alkylhydroperoxidase family enzyme
VRFAVAREQGLTEEQVTQIDEGYDESSLSDRDKATLILTDAIVGDPRSLTAEDRAAIAAELRPDEMVEVSLGVGLFMALSKVLITLGLEPEEMDTTIVPTPGSY